MACSAIQGRGRINILRDPRQILLLCQVMPDQGASSFYMPFARVIGQGFTGPYTPVRSIPRQLSPGAGPSAQLGMPGQQMPDPRTIDPAPLGYAPRASRMPGYQISRPRLRPYSPLGSWYRAVQAQGMPSPRGFSGRPTHKLGKTKYLGLLGEPSYLGHISPVALYWQGYNARIDECLSNPSFDAELGHTINSDPTHTLNTYEPRTQPTFGPNGRCMVRMHDGMYLETPSHDEMQKEAQNMAQQGVMTKGHLVEYENNARR